MKVPVNGGLNLSVRDGGWDEAYAADVGWTIETADDPGRFRSDARGVTRA